jgi:hypothetical protein
VGVARRRPKKHSASDEPYALAERQREHRLRERVKPKTPVEPNADPWLLAAEGLDAVHRVRRPPLYGERGSSVARDLDVIEERLRQLAWGPTELPAPTFDLTTHSGRMKRNMHLRWHVRGGHPCNCWSP